MAKPKITAKQEGGNDGYCYVVRVNGKEFISGLTRNEVPYYKAQALKEWEKGNAKNKMSKNSKFMQATETSHGRFR